jgi:DNA-binding IclR family transcriptional regulator
MPDSETLVVFRILGILATARDGGRSLPIEQIAEAARLGRPTAARYMNMLELARAVRTKVSPAQPAQYSLTQYGLERLAPRRL